MVVVDKHNQGRGKKITIIVLSVFVGFFALLIGGLIWLVIYLRKSRVPYTEYHLDTLAKKCSSSTKDQLCLCNLNNDSIGLCASLVENNVKLSVLGSSITVPLKELSTDEDQAKDIKLYGQKALLFQHPEKTNTVCLRSEDPNEWRRLCYDFSNSTAFLTGPTKTFPLNLS